MTVRHPIIVATRASRQNYSTFVATDANMSTEWPQDAGQYRETWAFYPNGTHGPLAGDDRGGLTPFLAHDAFSGKFKWMLYGDDDTFFFLDNVKPFLAKLDPNEPYLITDNQWHRAGHPSIAVPTCLPVNYVGPTDWLQNETLAQVVGSRIARFYSVPDTNVTLSIIPRPMIQLPGGCDVQLMCRPPNNLDPMLIREWGMESIFPQCYFQPPHCGAGVIHGGAGAILSIGLFRKMQERGIDTNTTVQWMEKHIARTTGGDALFTMLIKCLLNFTPTNPGSFYDSQLTMFDPNLGHIDSIRQRAERGENVTDAELRRLLSTLTHHFGGRGFFHEGKLDVDRLNKRMDELSAWIARVREVALNCTRLPNDESGEARYRPVAVQDVWFSSPH